MTSQTRTNTRSTSRIHSTNHQKLIGKPNEKGKESLPSTQPNPGTSGTNSYLTDIAFLEPMDIDGNVPNHPVNVGKILSKEKFSSFKEITKVGRFRFKVELNRKEDYAIFARINLAAHNLKLFQPMSLRETICFVRGVPKEYSEEEIKENIWAEEPVLKVERIMRKKEEQLVPTWNLKITVKGTKVPSMVKIYHCAFRTEVYVFPVKQCTRCWRFGHTAKNCKANPRCKTCSYSHEQGDCQSRSKCANCNEEHAADDRECRERKRRSNVIREMHRSGKSYYEAEAKFPKLMNRFELLDEEAEYPEINDNRQTGTETNLSRTWTGNSRTARNKYKSLGQPRIAQQSEKTTEQELHNQADLIPVNATLIESMLASVRRELIKQLRTKIWLKPLIDLRNDVQQQMNSTRTEIDTDQILIHVFEKINNIITAEIDNINNNPNESRIVNSINNE